MPKGGRRVGAGRPTREQVAERTRVLLESIKPDEELDIRAILEAMIRNPATPKTDRFKAMELHMKLPREPLPRRSNNNSPLTIYSLPRGSSVDRMTGKIVIPEAAELIPIEPFTGTPSLANDTTQNVKRELDERLAVMGEVAIDAEPSGNVKVIRPSYGRTFATGRRLDAPRRRDDDEPESAA